MVTHSDGFQNFPVTTLSCVLASADLSYNNTGCSVCSSTQLSTSGGCRLISYDGYTTTYCSRLKNGNRQQVTSCYVGTFSTSYTNTAKPTACSHYNDFCQVSLIKLKKLNRI